MGSKRSESGILQFFINFQQRCGIVFAKPVFQFLPCLFPHLRIDICCNRDQAKKQDPEIVRIAEYRRQVRYAVDGCEKVPEHPDNDTFCPTGRILPAKGIIHQQDGVDDLYTCLAAVLIDLLPDLMFLQFQYPNFECLSICR